jgi:hypothetical protein
MAEFCKNCADNYGFETNASPLLCEGCGKEFPRQVDCFLVLGLAVVAAFLIILFAFAH